MEAGVGDDQMRSDSHLLQWLGTCCEGRVYKVHDLFYDRWIHGASAGGRGDSHGAHLEEGVHYVLMDDATQLTWSMENYAAGWARHIATQR